MEKEELVMEHLQAITIDSSEANLQRLRELTESIIRLTHSGVSLAESVVRLTNQNNGMSDEEINVWRDIYERSEDFVQKAKKKPTHDWLKEGF